MLAHSLAATAIGFQTGLGELSRWLKNLARTELPEKPSPFAEVAGRVEELPGVKFRQLFDRLPQRAPDGDAALAEVWKLVASLPSQEEVLAGVPKAVRDALAAGDVEALQGALGEMPAEEAEALVEQLRAAQDDFDADAVGEADLDVAALEVLGEVSTSTKGAPSSNCSRLSSIDSTSSARARTMSALAE